MADDNKRTNPSGQQQMTEASPNPHNEADVAETPVETDHRHLTRRENVAQTPSTREGRLDPSVAEGVAGGSLDHDSMFNQADPQGDPGREDKPAQKRERDRKSA